MPEQERQRDKAEGKRGVGEVGQRARRQPVRNRRAPVVAQSESRFVGSQPLDLGAKCAKCAQGQEQGGQSHRDPEANRTRRDAGWEANRDSAGGAAGAGSGQSQRDTGGARVRIWGWRARICEMSYQCVML